MADMVNHPSHYTSTKYEVIDIIEEFTKGLTGIEAVCIGNVIKYVLRYQFKNGLEDLEKARWYLDKAISIKSEQVKADEVEEDENVYLWREYFTHFKEEALKLGATSSTCLPIVACIGVSCTQCRSMALTRKEWRELLEGDEEKILDLDFVLKHTH